MHANCLANTWDRLIDVNLPHLCRRVKCHIKCEVVVCGHRMRRQAEAVPAADVTAGGCTAMVEAKAADLHAQQDDRSHQQQDCRRDAGSAYQDHLRNVTNWSAQLRPPL